jgi:hypothetical protein
MAAASATPDDVAAPELVNLISFIAAISGAATASDDVAARVLRQLQADILGISTTPSAEYTRIAFVSNLAKPDFVTTATKPGFMATIAKPGFIANKF